MFAFLAVADRFSPRLVFFLCALAGAAFNAALLAAGPSLAALLALRFATVNINAKSPLSGAIGDSQASGFFPAEMKFSGFERLVIKGKSPKPVFLLLKDGEASLHDATHLTGKITGEVEATLKKELNDPKIEVMQVGPAAEKGVRYASIMNMSNRAAGRTGMGLVLASKNLKAIVARGKTKPEVAHPDRPAGLNHLGPKYMPDNPDMDSLGKLGTASVVMFQNTIGSLPSYIDTNGLHPSMLLSPA